MGHLIDGTRRGSIGSGAELTIAVEPGPHEVSALSDRLGRMDVDILAVSGEQLGLACTASLKGLLDDRSGRIPGGPIGQPPFELISLLETELPAEPVIDRRVKARMYLSDLELLAEQGPFWRFFVSVVMRHLTLWATFVIAFLGWWLYEAASASNPSAVNIALAACLLTLWLATLLVQILMHRWSHQPDS